MTNEKTTTGKGVRNTRPSRGRTTAGEVNRLPPGVGVPHRARGVGVLAAAMIRAQRRHGDPLAAGELDVDTAALAADPEAVSKLVGVLVAAAAAMADDLDRRELGAGSLIVHRLTTG